MGGKHRKRQQVLEALQHREGRAAEHQRAAAGRQAALQAHERLVADAARAKLLARADRARGLDVGRLQHADPADDLWEW